MVDINQSIFKKYDIRGKAMGDDAVINNDVAFAIGQAIGTYFQRFHQTKQVVVGRDNRHTAYDLQSALMAGIQRAGGDIMDIGLVSTPLVYWYAVDKDNIGGVMVTGSHLAPEYNGFKTCLGAQTIFGGEIKVVQSIITENQYTYGSGQYNQNTSAYSQYLFDLRQRLPMHGQLKIAYDPGNGTAGIFAPRLFEHWQQDATGINVEPDGSYPNHQPDPQKAENMTQLGAKVREIGAAVGFAYDGDADRVGLVDEKGAMISADRILALLARDMLQRNHGAVVVGDALSSQTLFDVIKQSGGKPIMAPSGHSLVKDVMREHNALLGGEVSGHMFFAENYFGFDDAYFATGLILQILARSNKPLSEMNAELPNYFSTPEYRPHCDDEYKDKVLEGMKQALSDEGEIITVDGVRVQFESGWGIIRKSNTEPVLSLRFEGLTESDAHAYRDKFINALKAYPMVAKFV
ncbi:MAG: phosphomannomutase/phosphoglucomutase [Anaerolineae bacterium]|nr:phosphomannomutase/phosphoglucomutase [Anaerolineae bacterium]